jgi:hypothetical protein
LKAPKTTPVTPFGYWGTQLPGFNISQAKVGAQSASLAQDNSHVPPEQT